MEREKRQGVGERERERDGIEKDGRIRKGRKYKKKNKIGTATGMIAGRRRGKDSDGDPI